MPILIVKEESYGNSDVIENLVNYVLNPVKIPTGLCGGSGINMLSIDTIIHHMTLTQKLYGEKGVRKARHFIISFADYENLILQDVILYANCATNYFETLNHQVLCAIHERNAFGKACKLHIHIIVNTVNYTNGKKYYGSYQDSDNFLNCLKSLNGNSLKWRIAHEKVEYN